MGERANHKYIDKVITKNGNVRYIYDNKVSSKDAVNRRNEAISESGSKLLDSVGQYVRDEFTNKFTESSDAKYERQKRQRNEIAKQGKEFVESFYKSL